MAPSAIGSEEASFAIPRNAEGVTAAVSGRVGVEAAGDLGAEALAIDERCIHGD